jgi:hypothetical protein
MRWVGLIERGGRGRINQIPARCIGKTARVKILVRVEVEGASGRRGDAETGRFGDSEAAFREFWEFWESVMKEKAPSRSGVRLGADQPGRPWVANAARSAKFFFLVRAEKKVPLRGALAAGRGLDWSAPRRTPLLEGALFLRGASEILTWRSPPPRDGSCMEPIVS